MSFFEHITCHIWLRNLSTVSMQAIFSMDSQLEKEQIELIFAKCNTVHWSKSSPSSSQWNRPGVGLFHGSIPMNTAANTIQIKSIFLFWLERYDVGESEG